MTQRGSVHPPEPPLLVSPQLGRCVVLPSGGRWDDGE
jgi:hypothetical protein